MVIIYEDVASGKRANRFCENLLRKLGETVLSTKDLWSFKVLDIPQVRRVAAEASAGADVVILALDGHAELPEGVRAWMEEWGKGDVGRNPVLIALFNTSDDELQGNAASTRAFFTAVAETSGLTFLHTQGRDILGNRDPV